MAELILGALGVVPLIGIALKTYKRLCTELKTYRRCSTVVNRVHKKLKTQRLLFENECELILRDCLDKRAVQAMMANPGHESWRDKKQDESLKGLLKMNYETCAGLVQDILEAAQQLESGLACFQALKPHKQEGEKIKDTWIRLKDGMRLCFNKSEFASGLDDLRASNSDLKALREQVTQLRAPCRAATKRPATAPGWADIRRAAKALHEALASAWSCEQASHVRHFVKLFLEAEKADEEVYMDIAILCYGYGRGPGDASLIQLQVRSGYTEWSRPPTALPLPGPGNAGPRKRVKAVRFSEECSATYTHCIASAPAAGSRAVQPEGQINNSEDLRALRDFCSGLRVRCGQEPSSVVTRCLGHLDVKSYDNLRHSFYSCHGSVARRFCPSTVKTGDLVPMDAFLHETEEGTFSTADRLKMARSLVLAVLKFHATPWLGDAWRLQDFSLFRRGQDVNQSLKTLHLGIEFDHGNPQQASNMEDIQLTQSGTSISLAGEDERLFCGIENMTLHSLGAVLLQIDRMSKFEPEDVLGVRKAAKLGSSLGPRYQEITQKCLRCDFGYGTDLGKAQLQKAVHESLIGALEAMISSLSIDDDAE